MPAPTSRTELPATGMPRLARCSWLRKARTGPTRPTTPTRTLRLTDVQFISFIGQITFCLDSYSTSMCSDREVHSNREHPRRKGVARGALPSRTELQADAAGLLDDLEDRLGDEP